VSLKKLFPLALLVALSGCDRFKLAEAKAEEPAHAEAPGESAASAEPGHAEKHGDEAKPAGEAALKYDVPFAWEVSKTEPLAKTRAFLAEALADNDSYRQKGDKYFSQFVKAQAPRATIVSCSDSRVHSHAWDQTPDNDDFIVRNIGNQVKNAHGSVEYGIEHLKTPLLLIVGHTGCGAVKAALGETSKLSAPIRDELKPLVLAKPAAGADEERAWTDAVVANVNQQVSFAVQHFGKPIREGTLTVIGTVYDLKGGLGGGLGKLHIVNVNGNSEAERMQAFASAIGKAPALAESASPGDTHEQRLIETLRKTPGFEGHVAIAEH
jgi:carbonic anhydrase